MGCPFKSGNDELLVAAFLSIDVVYIWHMSKSIAVSLLCLLLAGATLHAAPGADADATPPDHPTIATIIKGNYTPTVPLPADPARLCQQPALHGGAG
jgi:hypothetical protein